MKKDDKKTLIVVLIVCIICGLIIFFTSRKSNTDKLVYVNDYSTFFSITREVNNYISYMVTNNDNVKTLLDDRYLESNTIIDSKNYSVLSELSTNDIEYVKIGNNYLYLVKGKIIENDFDSTNIIDDNYMILVLNDISNNTYSLYPVNNDNYKKVINSIKKINIDSNPNNKMIESENITDVQICKLYFSDYVSKLFNNTEDAYEMLNDSMKKRFDTYEEFNKYISDNVNKITSSSKLCNMDEYKDNRVYTVIDNNDNSYSFSENGVMNYKVNFYFKSNEE